jgi:murein DD-endopeptidase MepM/ murein hydrolase activator NlpD
MEAQEESSVGATFPELLPKTTSYTEDLTTDSLSDSPKRPSLNFAFLYLLVLIGIGFYLSRGRLWEQRIRSPLAEPNFVLSDFTSSPVGLISPNLTLNNSGRVSHYVRSGEKISTLFHRFGLNESEAPEVEKAIDSLGVKEELSLRPKPGRKVVIRLSKNGELRRFRYQVSREQEVIVSRRIVNSAPTYEAKLVAQPAFELQVAARGEIRTSFNAAAKNTRIPAEITDDIADLFSNRLNFKKDFQSGDRFSVIYRQKMLKGSPAGVAGPIIAVVFESDGKNYYALRYVGADGKARYFDENGKLLGDSFLRFPVQFSKITSVFTDARFHPVLRISRPHNGTDFAAPPGTPVRSIGEGQVIFAGYKGPNGNMVKIRHNDRFTTEYLHLSSIAPGIRRGTSVSRGQLIGAVGSTGLSTGSHLHFGLFDRGKYVDPLKTILPNSENLGRDKAIDKKYLSGLLLTLKRYQDEELEGTSNRTVSVVEKRHS